MIGPLVFTDSEAACRAVDPDLFFPSSGQGSVTARRVAREICGDCPLRVPCFDYAIRHLEWGIWSGTTERERRDYRRKHGITAEVPLAVLSTTPSAIRKRQLRAGRAA